jgi:hypothetical protein
MPLSRDDISRLKGLGYDVGVFTVMGGGAMRLSNVDDRCFFLGEAGCTVYEDRPTGCRFYPLVLDGGRVIVDPDCTHGEMFTVGPGDASRLKSFLRLLRRERRMERVR